MVDVKIDKGTGEVSVDGTVINPKNWNIKQVEKAAVYVATIITTTNVFGQIPLPNSVKEWVLGGAAFIIAAIHVSTPKAP